MVEEQGQNMAKLVSSQCAEALKVTRVFPVATNRGQEKHGNALSMSETLSHADP